MKAALIPPVGYYKLTYQSDYHLALAHLDDPAYIHIYRNVPSMQYVILDNGMAEGVNVGADRLIRRANAMYVQEIVLPDVMKEGEATVSLARHFLDNYSMPPHVRYMAVMQGHSRDEALRCMDGLLDISAIHSIGIPRHFLETFGDRYARIKILNELKDSGKAVHLLGTSAVWSSEVLAVALEHPWVRGVDTSMPFNYAIARVELKDGAEPVSRPELYFDRRRTIDLGLLQANIDTYLGWVNGTEGARG